MGRRSKFVVNGVIWPCRSCNHVSAFDAFGYEKMEISEFQNSLRPIWVSVGVLLQKCQGKVFIVLGVGVHRVHRGPLDPFKAFGAGSGVPVRPRWHRRPLKTMSDIVISQYISIPYPSYPTASIDQTQSSIDTSHEQPLISSNYAICLATIISFQLSFG